jgi:hypothetical protein
MQSDHKKQLITLTVITLRGLQFHNNIINCFVPDKAIELPFSPNCSLVKISGMKNQSVIRILISDFVNFAQDPPYSAKTKLFHVVL